MNSCSREFVIPGTVATPGLITLATATPGFGTPRDSARDIATRAGRVDLEGNVLRLIRYDTIRKEGGPRLQGSAARRRISGACPMVLS